MQTLIIFRVFIILGTKFYLENNEELGCNGVKRTLERPSCKVFYIGISRPLALVCDIREPVRGYLGIFEPFFFLRERVYDFDYIWLF